MELAIVGDRVTGKLTLDERHQGAPGFAHGGALATALDDALGTVLVVIGMPGVTARLEVDYRRPALLGREFVVEAWLEREDGRKIHMAAELRDGDNVIAEARALFLQVEAEHFMSGGGVPDEWRKKWWRKGGKLPY
jgi:acyl-coenzyme A thioesterase PaaI-like protein